MRTKGGNKITPELVDALATEAERGNDLSKAKGRRTSESPKRVKS